MNNTIICGTCHFINLTAAIRYYADYGYSQQDVNRKLLAGDIRIGHPELKPGERLLLDRAEGRYKIESPLQEA